MAPKAPWEQMLGGWHSEPADANYCAKQFVKCVSPHHALKRQIYGQTECGSISTLFPIIFAVMSGACLLLGENFLQFILSLFQSFFHTFI